MEIYEFMYPAARNVRARRMTFRERFRLWKRRRRSDDLSNVRT